MRLHARADCPVSFENIRAASGQDRYPCGGACGSVQGVEASEPSSAIRGRIAEARKIQNERFKGSKIHCNAMMSGRQIRKHCKTDEKTTGYLGSAAGKLRLSARGCSSILKVARTIADLEGISEITTGHISEAIQYRSFDRPI